MKKENWNPEADRYLKSGERELHQFLHSTRTNEAVDWRKLLGKKDRRWLPFQRASEKCGGIRGRILEVGAGDGWCSAAVLRHYEIEESFIMEIDEAAIDSLIPETLRNFEVDDKNVTLVLGSFNSIPYVDYFDFVIAMGSLHHSENLFVTLRSLWSALKPGGSLLSQEPAMADSTSNEFYRQKSQQVKKFKEGIEFRNEERSDHFYRKCEYYTALHHAGFEVDLEELAGANPAPTKKTSIWSRLMGGVGEKPTVESSPNTPTNIFIRATKPLSGEASLPITAWESI
ncbi:MAG: class I SAM-dependent methyltransferase [Verrucomicrobiae bacterium]|nr:class I SAM-dependent methyltransferase [Verrucomicrobiae bacterium]